MSETRLVEHFFRHEYGRLVAILSRRIGVKHIEDIEDAVQSALIAALERWTIGGVPENPSAWLFRVAMNDLLGELRKGSRRRQILVEQFGSNLTYEDAAAVLLSTEVQDDMLRMLFVCCDDSIPSESQLVFALKTLCGFDVREIASRLFTSETNVYKRLSRARSRLREINPSMDELSESQLGARAPSVRKILYLLFTEGHLSSNSESALRRDLCLEAIRLTTLLIQNPVADSPETSALLALMHLQFARMPGRSEEGVGLLLLEEQNRELWDQDKIDEGLFWLQRSAEGDQFSRYHAEAGIAAEHCLAPSFSETRWDRVAECYELLEHSTASPIHRLNRSLAVAEWKGPSAGLAILEDFEPPTWLVGSWLWAATKSDLLRRCGHMDKASEYRKVAISSAPTEQIKQLLTRRFRQLDDKDQQP